MLTVCRSPPKKQVVGIVANSSEAHVFIKTHKRQNSDCQAGRSRSMHQDKFHVSVQMSAHVSFPRVAEDRMFSMHLVICQQHSSLRWRTNTQWSPNVAKRRAECAEIVSTMDKFAQQHPEFRPSGALRPNVPATTNPHSTNAEELRRILRMLVPKAAREKIHAD